MKDEQKYFTFYRRLKKSKSTKNYNILGVAEVNGKVLANRCRHGNPWQCVSVRQEAMPALPGRQHSYRLFANNSKSYEIISRNLKFEL